MARWLTRDVDGNEAVHFAGPFGNSALLCGLTMDGDPLTVPFCRPIRGRSVTCDACIAIVRHCKRLTLDQPCPANSPEK